MADQRLHSLNLIARERYLAASSSSRDLLQHTADILCQSVCTLRVYSHGLAARLMLFRHCFVARKLEKVLAYKCRGVSAGCDEVRPSPRFNDSPSPAVLLRICHKTTSLPVQESTYTCVHVNAVGSASIATAKMYLPLPLGHEAAVPYRLSYCQLLCKIDVDETPPKPQHPHEPYVD